MHSKSSRLSLILKGVLHLSPNPHVSVRCTWNGWRWCAESQDTPKFRGPTAPPNPSLSPYLIMPQLDLWWPCTCQDVLSEVISLHSGEKKIIKGWAWRLPAPCGCAGGCQCRPAPLCPFELRPWGEHCCSVSSPLSGFYPFKGNLATKPSVEHQLCWTSCCSGCPEPG